MEDRIKVCSCVNNVTNESGWNKIYRLLTSKPPKKSYHFVFQVMKLLLPQKLVSDDYWQSKVDKDNNKSYSCPTM